MKMFKEGEFKLLWPFYLDSLISPMLFFLPAFMVVYFRDLGFSMFQISFLTMMGPLAMLLFEIPTGAFADLYGRKLSVLFASIIQGIALTSIFFLNNYYALLFAFALGGFGSTFNSGAREAWITDLIKKERKDFLHRYFVKSSSLDSLGLVVSGLLGVFLVKRFGLSIIWIIGGVSFFLTFLILIFAKEHFVKQNAKLKNSFRAIFKKSVISVKYAKNHPVLLLFLISTALIVFSSQFNESLAWTPLLQELGLSDYAFGYLWSAMGILGIFSPFVSMRFLKKDKEKRFILFALLASILVLFLVIFVNNLFLAFLIILSQLFFSGMSRPAERIYFHRFIKNKIRATVGSVESMLMGFIGLLAMPLAGLSLDYLGPRHTIFISALILVFSAFIFSRIKDKST